MAVFIFSFFLNQPCIKKGQIREEEEEEKEKWLDRMGYGEMGIRDNARYTFLYSCSRAPHSFWRQWHLLWMILTVTSQK